MSLIATQALRWARRHPVLSLAAAGAATALWARRQGHQAEREHPPIGRFIEVDGVRLHYIDQGSGPPVVLLHGNTVLLQDFIGSGIIDRLSRHHRVLAFDRPGFGYSTRPRDRKWSASAQSDLLVHALDRLGVDQPVVLGHSWGALAALAMATEHPGRVQALVLVSGYYYPTARLDVALTAPAALPVLGDAMRYTISPWLGRMTIRSMARAMFSPRPVPPDFFEPLSRGMMLRPWQMRAAVEDASLMIPAAQRLSLQYPHLHVPVHILAGEGDKVVDPQAHAVRLHEALSDSELQVLPGVGHMVHYAAPQQIEAAIERVSKDPRQAPLLLAGTGTPAGAASPAEAVAAGGVTAR